MSGQYFWQYGDPVENCSLIMTLVDDNNRGQSFRKVRDSMVHRDLLVHWTLFEMFSFGSHLGKHIPPGDR